MRATSWSIQTIAVSQTIKVPGLSVHWANLSDLCKASTPCRELVAEQHLGRSSHSDHAMWRMSPKFEFAEHVNGVGSALFSALAIEDNLDGRENSTLVQLALGASK